ncbi:MAG: XRE family transcriptional regulator [Thermotogae bacterium]|jgi:repressor LexA|nr:XRE family transcriptional regulator [Thermotogota bacterium]
MISENKLAERLEEIRKIRGISREKLAQQVEISTVSIYNYEHGSQDPSASVLARMAAVLNVSVDYLLGNIDKPDRDEKSIAFVPSKRVPLISAISPKDTYESISKSAETFAVPELFDVDFALKVSTDEMDPIIKPSDVILVKMNLRAEKGDIIIVIVDDKVFLREFHYYDRLVVLRSPNPKYPEIEIQSHQYHPLGVVISKYEELKKQDLLK